MDGREGNPGEGAGVCFEVYKSALVDGLFNVWSWFELRACDASIPVSDGLKLELTDPRKLTSATMNAVHSLGFLPCSLRRGMGIKKSAIFELVAAAWKAVSRSTPVILASCCAMSSRKTSSGFRDGSTPGRVGSGPNSETSLVAVFDMPMRVRLEAALERGTDVQKGRPLAFAKGRGRGGHLYVLATACDNKSDDLLVSAGRLRRASVDKVVVMAMW